MNNADFLNTVDEFFRSIRELMSKKNADYSAGSGDSLFDYYDTAERLEVTPIKAWGVLFLKHIHAVEKFIKTGRVESEPIEERLKDIAAYSALAYALVKELKQKQKEKAALATAGIKEIDLGIGSRFLSVAEPDLASPEPESKRKKG